MLIARTRSIKVLDHALSGDAGTEACERFVDVLGLKSLFSVFMNKVMKRTYFDTMALLPMVILVFLRVFVGIQRKKENRSNHLRR